MHAWRPRTSPSSWTDDQVCFSGDGSVWLSCSSSCTRVCCWIQDVMRVPSLIGLSLYFPSAAPA